MDNHRKMRIRRSIFLTLLFPLLFLLSHSTVCYGRVAKPATSLSRDQLLNSNGISRIRLFNPDRDALAPFSGTGIELMIGVPNEILPMLANGTVATSQQWLKSNIFTYVTPNQVRYINNKEKTTLDYALFRSSKIEVDQNLPYTNMFDATIDAFVYAMEREGFHGIPVVVTETGWPKGGADGASVDNALAYNGNVVMRALANIGTPKRPGVGIEVFLFDLFDENGKSGGEYERHFGIFEVNGIKAYDIRFN
ncbi:UNVERIFIED_CONTAM: putative glucan endo-1,3-beta-glucosidase [Sesamum radiatum]|uniref:Glucan endo-1,3-beta-glucosidase n=1 Tax=Sesamum radiatum TaxID=300843 RepID=A0AAW2MZY9_SESRA